MPNGPLAALTESMRQMMAAIATCDLPRLEEIIDLQRILVGFIANDPSSVLLLSQQRPEVIRELTINTAILTSVLRHCSQTCRTLLSFVVADEALCSLETLPRR